MDRRDNPEDRRRALRVVPDERRSSYGSRNGDVERQYGLARVYQLHLPAYMLHDAEQSPQHGIVMTERDAEIQSARGDKYFHMHFTEHSDPDLAQEAWRIHAEGYHAMGFVKDEALTPEGFLAEGIDKSRGPNTLYYLGLNPENDYDGATLRKMFIAPGGSYKDHPSYKSCETALSQEGKDLLETLQEQGVSIIEIAAMAKSFEGNPASMHEVIRDAMQAGIKNNEVWFFGLVSKTHDRLQNQWGPDVFTIIGNDVPINDERVTESIALRPCLLYTGVFLDNVLHAYTRAASQHEAKKLRRSFLYYAEGLDEQYMSDEVRTAQRQMLAEKDAPRGE